MKHTFEKTLAAGLVAVVTLAGCGEVQRPLPLRVVADFDVQLYKNPYDIQKGPGPKAGILKMGSKVLATCLAETELPQFSSVRVEGDETGYSGVYLLEGSNDTTPTLIFDKNLDELRDRLPDC